MYQYISLINYLRKNFVSHHCFSCAQEFELVSDLVAHLDEAKHEIPVPPNHELYTNPLYLFPTVDGDPLLMLDCDDADADLSRKENEPIILVVAEPVDEDIVTDLANLSVEARMDWLSSR